MKHIIMLSCLAAGLIFSACGDGDPGPQGPEGERGKEGSGSGLIKRGYFTGTVTGVRRDGTSFSETFDYQYARDVFEGFSYDWETGSTLVTIIRQKNTNADEGFINLQFKVLNAGTENERIDFHVPYEWSWPFNFRFAKEMESSGLFQFVTYSRMRNIPFRRIISREENAKYKFVEDEKGHINDYYEDNETFGSVYFLYNTDGDKIYFEPTGERYDAFNNYYYGAFLKMVSPDGSETSTSSLYSELRYVGDRFYLESTSKDISELIAEDDQYEITNYSHDNSTGVLSFDFTATIGIYGAHNPTRHPITITGSFNSGDKVYSKTITRVRE